MEPLLITTQVDLTGINQLAPAVSAAATQAAGSLGKIGEAAAAAQAKADLQLRELSQDLAQLTAAARIQAESLKDAYLEMGEAAAAGSEKAIQSIAEQEQALAETKAQILAVRREMSEAAQTKVQAATVGGATTDDSGVGEAGAGAAEGQLALAASNDALSESALEASASLGALAAAESRIRATTEQASGLEALATAESTKRAGALEHEAAVAAVTTRMNDTLAQSAMLDAEAWEQAYTAETTAAQGSEVLAAEKAELTEATLANAGAAEVEAAATRSGISDRQAATASLSLLRGNMMGSSRAAAAFLTTVAGIGPILQAAFPIIGAIALVEILSQIPKAFDSLIDSLAGWDKAREKSFKSAVTETEQLIGSYAKLSEKEAELAVPSILTGPAKINAEVDALGNYQQKLTTLNDQLLRVKSALDAAKETTIFAPEGGEGGIPIKIPAYSQLAENGDQVKAQVKSQLDDLNTLLAKFAQDHNQPIPIPLAVDFSTSTGTVQKQLDDVLAAARKTIKELAEKQEETNLGKQGKQGTAGAEETKEEFSADDARLASKRKADEGIVEVDEATQKHLLETGQITGAQEIAALELDTQRKLQIQISYLEALDAAKSKQDVTEGKKPELDTSIIENIGEIQALRSKAQADEISGIDAVRNANIKSLQETTDAQVEEIKAVPAANVHAEEEADQQIVALRTDAYRQILAITAGSGAEYRSALKDLLDAERELGESIKKASDEATEHKLENLQREAEADEKNADQEATRARAGVETGTKQQEETQAVTYKQETAGPFVAPESKTAAAQSNAAAELAIAQSAAQQEEAIDLEAANRKTQDLQQELQQDNAAYLAGEQSAEKYEQEAERVARELTEVTEQEATKRTAIADREAQQESAIQQRLLETYMQIEQQETAAITNFVGSATSQLNQFAVTIATTIGEVDGKISESRYIGEQFNKLWIDIERGFLQMVLKMLEESTLFQGLEKSLRTALTNAFSIIPGLKPPPLPISVVPQTGAANGISTAPTLAQAGIQQAPLPSGVLTAGLPNASGVTSAATAPQDAAASSALATFTTSVESASAAMAQQAPALTTAATAQTSQAAAITTNTAAQTSQVGVITVNAASQSANAAAVTTGTAAHAANSASVFTSTAAHILNALGIHVNTTAHTANTGAILAHTAVTNAGTGAQSAHTAVTTSSTAAQAADTAATSVGTGAQASDTAATIAHAAAMTADTVAVSADTTAEVVHTAVLGFEEGGVIPYTGLHLLHAGERVLNVNERAEYESHMASGYAGLDSPFPGSHEGTGGTGGPSHITGDSNFALHWHEGNHSALDTGGMAGLLKNSRGALIGAFKNAVKSGAISPRDILRHRG